VGLSERYDSGSIHEGPKGGADSAATVKKMDRTNSGEKETGDRKEKGIKN